MSDQTPDDAALAEAERLHREGYKTAGFEAGAAWQRARIAARRDDASDAVQRARAATYPDEPTSTAIVDAVLAALGVRE